MRMLLKWESGLEPTNDAIRTGKIVEFNRALAERVQPEAAYYCTDNGRRTAYIFFDLADSSDMPAITEPLFQELGSTVEFIPVMNAEELQRGLAKAAQG